MIPESTPRERFEALMLTHAITVEAVFVPWSRSRSATKDQRFSDYNLNWSVTIKKNGREIIASDYSAGMAYCPSYKASAYKSIDHVDAIVYECEHGRRWRGMFARHTEAITPDPIQVFAAFCRDADAIDYARYEDWAADLGYDPDSRKGELVYRQCLSAALSLRAALGDTVLTEMRELAREI